MLRAVDRKTCEAVGLPMTEGAATVEYRVGDKVVYISYSFFGQTVDSHIAAKGKSKLLLREAVNVFCAEVFETFPFVEKIAGSVMETSVVNLLKKCGFTEIGQMNVEENDEIKNIKLMARFNNGIY